MNNPTPQLELNNAEFRDVYNLIRNTNSSVYMTGRAGTGKSTFLKYIVSNIHKKNVVLAPTGIAAVNAGGVTLHSFFKLPLHPFMPDDADFSSPARLKERLKYSREKIKLIEQLELIVIDEVSMVRADILDLVDRILRTYTNRRNVPFGGKQLLLVGDAFQLEPVVKREEWDLLRRYYTSPYFFGALVFRQIDLVQIELQKVYRQHEHQFLALLDKVRISRVAQPDLDAINSRVVADFAPDDDQMYVTLTSMRATADTINDSKLAAIDDQPSIFDGIIHGEYPESSLPTNRQLTLKRGAQIVFVKNDSEKRWYNGTIARIVDIEDDGVWVETDSLDNYFVARESWDNVRYRYDKEQRKIVHEVLGSFTQLPIKLAWAITIHKSQGLTFDRVIIDIGRGAFACGQVYVALSRCRTLDGVVLRTPVSQRDIMTSNSVVNFSYAANDKQLIEKQLADAQATQLYAAANAAYNQRDFTAAVSYMAQAIALRPTDINAPHIQRFVATKLRIVTKMKRQLDRTAEQERKMRDQVHEFAHEYYLLAVECKRKYDDNRSAIANLNKALKLSPIHIGALQMRAEISIDNGDYQTAVDDTTVIIEREPKNTAALRQRASAHIKQRNYGNAYNDLLLAMRINANEPQTYHMLADTCRRLGEAEDAEKYQNIADDLEVF